ncbi:MAG TPA: YciI family protein [Bryobacteraceae bacterium]|nr:YciI family protein [Bryobacteraceae bacterium]
MQYALLIYTDEVQEAQRSPDEQKALMGAYYAFTTAVKEANNYVTGAPLQSTGTATTVRVRDGVTLTTDGPFAETKEQLAGFYLLNCKDLDEAIALGARIPGAASGSIEIRPIWVMG